MVAIVVAHSRNRVIGRDGGLPWHLPTDLKRFKELTTGATVVMGRKTYESIPERFRPLPGRRNVVVSRSGLRLEEALTDACFVIGGGEVYAQALPHADRVYATEIDADVDGDAFFPELAGFREVERSEPVEENGHVFRFVTYDRD
ncbi:MAG: dihydrofolate reductase [Actinomycetota bacterium]|nr:dihydrofolate reductase [Actinomycetota bacterium]MDQ5807486.1 dihydrofolate reductase [Actinomycetota bacterium]